MCALARVCALPLGERRSEDEKFFSRFNKNRSVFTKQKETNRQTLNVFVVFVFLDIFVNPTMSINNGSVGLVGYNVRLTKRQAIRGRSPVRFWYGILFLPIAVPGTARGAFWMLLSLFVRVLIFLLLRTL